jgi:hypothetical protein
MTQQCPAGLYLLTIVFKYWIVDFHIVDFQEFFMYSDKVLGWIYDSQLFSSSL